MISKAVEEKRNAASCPPVRSSAMTVAAGLHLPRGQRDVGDGWQGPGYRTRASPGPPSSGLERCAAPRPACARAASSDGYPSDFSSTQALKGDIAPPVCFM